MKFKTALPDKGHVYDVTLIDGDGRPSTHTIFATPSNDVMADTRLWILSKCRSSEKSIFHAYVRVTRTPGREYDETYFFNFHDMADWNLALKDASR